MVSRTRSHPHAALLTRWKSIPTLIPDHIIFCNIRILHNALPTERRRSAMGLPITVRGPESDNPCFLCGGLDPTPDARYTDSIEHLFGPCPVAQRARALFHTSLRLPPLPFL